MLLNCSFKMRNSTSSILLDVKQVDSGFQGSADDP